MKVNEIISIIICFIILLSSIMPTTVLAVDEIESIIDNNTVIEEKENNNQESADNEAETDNSINNTDETTDNVINNENFVDENNIDDENAVNENNSNNENDANIILENNASDILSLNLEETLNEELFKVKYSSHIQDYGWEKEFSKIDGEMSGTEGKSKRLEAIKIALGNSEKIPENASIKYQVHVQDYGWMNWKKNGEIAGTEGQSKRIEAIKIELEGLENYSVIYRTHVQDIGWTEWKSDGEIAGTIGESKRIEAIQIQILEEKYEKFKVSVVNGENTINEYLKNNTHYIFLSKDIDMSNLTINYAGNVSSSSFGNLDTVNKTITGNFLNTENFTITLATGDIKNVSVIQSDVPALFIDLNNNITQSTLDNGSKDDKYEASLNIVGAENDEYNISDYNIEIKGRGNTTWRMPKKPYQIKFDKKINLFGIGKAKAKKWVLIANYQDPTLLKNKIENDLCVNSELSNIPNSKFIDLYINGNYAGNYLLCDKIEVGNGRVELDSEDGVLAELDNAYYNEEEYNFQSSYSKNHFAIKEFQDDDLDANTKNNAMKSFKNAIENFEKALYSEDSTWEEISELIDVESFAKYYLINEFAENTDSYVTSTYLYKDGSSDVIHMGPTWDYDAAFAFQKQDENGGNPEVDFTLNYSETRLYMKELFKYPQFANIVNEIYENELKQHFNSINVKEEANNIKNSARMNSIVWYSEEEYNKKLNELNDWVTKRINYFNKTYYASKFDSNILYTAYTQNVGWKSPRKDGETSGTIGKSLRLEGIRIYIGNQVDEDISLEYQAHVENMGWQNWVENGEMAGTTGQGLRMEAIRIKLKGSTDYSIKYRVHVQDYGWMPWCHDGEIAGTVGQSKRIEAIEIKLVKVPKIEVSYTYNESKNTVTATISSDKKLSSINDSSWKLSEDKLTYTKEYSENDTYRVTVKDIDGIESQLQVQITQVVEPISMVKYSSHIQEIGWEKNYSKIDGATSGTSGQEKRLEAIKIALGNSEEIPENASIEYQVHVQDYGWMNWKQDGEIAGTEGQSKRIEAIRIKLTGLEGYAVLYRTHVQDIGWTGWSNNGEISGTVGKSKRIEAIQIKLVKIPKIEIQYTYIPERNTVKVEIISDKELSYISDSSWNLNDDKLCYTKEYDVNDEYDVQVKDIDGIESKLQIEITEVVEPISMVKYSSHIQGNGWEKRYSKIDGDISGTTGEEKRLEAIRISLGNSEEIPEGASIKYQVHVQNYGWMNWKQDGEIAGTIGESKRIEAIKINIEGMEEYCVEYRTYIEGSGWQKWKSDGEISGTTGEGKRIEAIQIRVVKKENKTIEPEVSYQAYIQQDGWQAEASENTIAGTTGQSKGIEALKINLKGASQENSIKYRAYVSNSWQDWVNSGEVTGAEGQAKNIEAIQIELENLEGYSVEYKVYISGYGWQKWRKNGEVAGTTNTGNKIEAIQIRIVYNTSETIEPEVSYQAYVQKYGWHEETVEGFMAGTEGQSKRVEALKINLSDVDSNAKVKYRVHVQDIGWQNWVSNGSLAGTTEQSKRIEAIQIKLEGLDEYTVEYQVHIQDYGWSDWMIDGETAGTTGESKRIEAIKIRIVPKYYREYKGIDVSEFNGTINWQSVKNSGVQFVMIRCAYRGYRTGLIVTDSQFDYNIQNASAVGIKVGIYFFSQATSISEAVEEANYAVNLARKYGYVSYPIAIDSEASGAENYDGRADGLDTALRTNVVAAFCNQVRNCGYEPMVYASRDWLYNNLEVTRLSTYETWLAHYTGSSTIKSDYKYNYTMWQYTSSGYVPGINTKVDLNIGYKRY